MFLESSSLHVLSKIHPDNFVFWLSRHLSIGADAHLPAKMEDAVAKRMLPSPANVLTAGLDVTVTSPGSLVRQPHAKEVCGKQITFNVCVVLQQCLKSTFLPIRAPDR